MFFKKFGEKIKSLFGGRKIDEAFFEELEDTLIGSFGSPVQDEGYPLRIHLRLR